MGFDYSIIIPQRNSTSTIPRLLDSIPISENIEIIIVDNSMPPINKSDIKSSREFKLLWSEPSKFAGGARNVGLKHATGKWIIFADADDYFSYNAFTTFYDYIESNADVVYFGMGGIYDDTGMISDRGDKYTKLVNEYLSGCISENRIRLSFMSPCSKMIKKSLIDKYKIKFDEVVASNDVYFSLLTGYYSEYIDANPNIVYIATVSKGSLTRRRDYTVIMSRYIVSLRRNKFLREKGLKQYQVSIMYYLYEIMLSKISKFPLCVMLLLRYRQNPFIGISRWSKTRNKVHENNIKESNYIIK